MNPWTRTATPLALGRIACSAALGRSPEPGYERPGQCSRPRSVRDPRRLLVGFLTPAFGSPMADRHEVRIIAARRLGSTENAAQRVPDEQVRQLDTGVTSKEIS